MIGDTYPFIDGGYIAERDEIFFIFLSEGKITIPKLIVFSPSKKDGAQYYNLGFGDLTIEREGYRVDDKVESNNGDVKKVFYTVVSTLAIFFEMHPESTVRIAGSSPQRTEIYRRLIARHWEQISLLYDVRGFIDNQLELFVDSVKFDYILVSKKKT
jgi:hypothetical protein